MACHRAAVVDLDGVLWRGGRPIEENVRGLQRFVDAGGRLVFLTNNSTRHRRLLAEKISRILSRPVDPSDVVTSGYSAAEWLRREKGCLRALPVGGWGLALELEEACHRVLEPRDWREAEAVVVGLDRHACYSRLAAAHRAITGGAVFVATNSDPNFPVEEGTEPGAGAIVAFLEASTGRPPDFDAGKPGTWILGLAMERLNEQPIVVGDRLDTDIEMARRAGLPALLVLTGITRRPPERLPPGVRVAASIEEAVNQGVLCG